MPPNRPAKKPYKPRHKMAALWLDAARAQARKHDAPFKGRGNLDALGAAIEKQIITYDEVDAIIVSSESVHPSEIPALINRLWALNGMKHFPLQPVEGNEQELIVPPTLDRVLEEYVSQLDEIARQFRKFLPDSERAGSSHRDEKYLDLFYNPGCRISPDDYRAFTEQWQENGPPKELMHREIAIRVVAPSYEEVFERWNQSLAHPRRITPNGIEYINPPKPKKSPVKKVDVQRELAVLALGVEVPTIDSDGISEYPPFDVDKLLEGVEALSKVGFPTITKGVRSPNTAFAARVVGRLANEIYPIPTPPDPKVVDQDQILGASKLYRKQLAIAENFQTEWATAFTTVNDVSEDLYGQNLSGLHGKIIDEVALRSILFIPSERLLAGARQVVDNLRDSIPTGPVTKPIFGR